MDHVSVVVLGFFRAPTVFAGNVVPKLWKILSYGVRRVVPSTAFGLSPGRNIDRFFHDFVVVLVSYDVVDIGRRVASEEDSQQLGPCRYPLNFRFSP